MPKRKCAVKYLDTSGIEHTVGVEAESLFEAAIRGLQRLQRLDLSLGADKRYRMFITVEVPSEPTTYAVMVQKLKTVDQITRESTKRSEPTAFATVAAFEISGYETTHMRKNNHES